MGFSHFFRKFATQLVSEYSAQHGSKLYTQSIAKFEVQQASEYHLP